MTLTPYEENLRKTMTDHLGCLVTVNGGTDRIVTTPSIEGDNAFWNYAGYVVDCVSHGVNLSRNW